MIRLTPNLISNDLETTSAKISQIIEDTTKNHSYDNWVYGKRINTSSGTVDLTGATATNYSTYAYQIIDCVEGDLFTVTISSNNGSYRAWCWCDASGNVVSKPVSNLTLMNEIITCPAGATKLLINTITSSKYFVYSGIFIRTYAEQKFANIVDPDDYSGTDSEKIMAAMNAIGEDGHGVIIIKRQFTLNSNILIKHSGSADARIIFKGMGGANPGFNMKQYAFRGYDGARSYGALSFVNILFKATNIMFDVDYVIRLNFENCVFNTFNHVIYGTRFAQTFYFTDCLFRNGTGYAIYETVNSHSSLIDIRIVSCVVEKSVGFIYGYGFHGIYITGCCIEGNDGLVLNARGDCRSIVVRDNYFEAQNIGFNGGADGNGVCFDFTGVSGIIHNIEISNNCFLHLNPGNKIILLPYRMFEHTKFTITGNFLSPARSSDPEETPSGAYLVAAHDNATNIYHNLKLSQNSRGNVYDPNHLIVTSDEGNPFVARMLVTNYWFTHNDQDEEVTKYNPGYWYICDDLDNLYEAGCYHISTDIPIANSPVNTDFYLINIRTNETIVQIAVTSDEIITRIGQGEWKSH